MLRFNLSPYCVTEMCNFGKEKGDSQAAFNLLHFWGFAQ